MTLPGIVGDFIDRINAHDVAGLHRLMAADHVLIDGLGVAVTGRDAACRAWQGYFEIVPDYRIRVERCLLQGPVVGMFGWAGGTVAHAGSVDAANSWEIPAAWQAMVGDGGVTSWQVYADNEPLRRILGRPAVKE